MRKVNFTVEIEKNDMIEFHLIKALKELLGASMIDYQILTDTTDLYKNDDSFKKICTEYNRIKRIRNDYINNHK